MSDNFPLTRALGLSVEVVWQDTPDPHSTAPRKIYFIRAADLEALLAKAPVVRVGKYSDKSLEYFTSHPGSGDYTHTALLVNVQPIVRRTDEQQLLHDIVEAGDWPINNLKMQEWIRDVQKRARKLLGEEG